MRKVSTIACLLWLVFSPILARSEPNDTLAIQSAVDSIGPYQIGGLIWQDNNYNGIHESYEPGLPGWQVRLSNGQFAYTDVQGYYSFENLNTGMYLVNPTVPTDWLQTFPRRVENYLYNGSLRLAGSANQKVEVVAVETDALGNTYIGGHFTGSALLNPTSDTHTYVARGSQDIFLIKFNANGSHAWTGTCGGSSQDTLGNLAIDAWGNIFIGGSFRSKSDLDPSNAEVWVQGEGQLSAFITRLNADGTFSWARTLGGSQASTAVEDLATDDQGNVFATGTFTKTVDFDPTDSIDLRTSPFQSGRYASLFVTRINSDGSYGWTNTSQSEPLIFNAYGLISEPIKIDIGPNNMLVIGGLYEGRIDFDPSSKVDLFKHKGDADIFITQQDTNGNYHGTWQIAGAEEDRIYDLCVDTNDDITFVGSYSGIVDFDPTSGRDSYRRTGKDVGWFVTHMNANGSYGWTQAWELGDGLPQSATGVTVDAFGNAYVALYEPYAEPWDARILALSNQGQINSNLVLGIHDSDTHDVSFDPLMLALSVDALGNLLIGGRFSNSVDLDPTASEDIHSAIGTHDGFVTTIAVPYEGYLVSLNPEFQATNADFGVVRVSSTP
ncbi:SdrD B-like domain-containing protein [Planctomycetota bacterium]